MVSAYEKQALAEIKAWKTPELGVVGRALQLANKPIDIAGDVVMQTPGIGWVIQKSVNGIVGVGNDFAQWSVRPKAVHEQYRKAGHSEVWGGADIRKLDLEEVDRVIGWLSAKYKGLALVEGGATGATGLAGLVVDIPALVTLNLRAIGEYATYCGFDVSTQQERLFAMNVLELASSPTDASKALAMAQLVRIAQDITRKQAWKNIEQHAFVALLQRLSKALGVRLTRAKLHQTIPLVGTVIGAGFNAYYTSRVCDAAYYLYRERFLAIKYGEAFLHAPVPPAQDLDPGYQEEDVDLESLPPPPVGEFPEG